MQPISTHLSPAALRRFVDFPDPRNSDDYGLVALGGTYEPAILLAAYAQGIFPWPSDELPFAWFSPDPRLVLPIESLHISRSLKKRLRQQTFEITFDTAFDRVIQACAAAPRERQAGTWINSDLMQGFLALHRQGLAHSVEAWRDGRLVGGLYGLAIGAVFCGESMFYHEKEASKVAFVHLIRRLETWDFHFVDCQVHTDHLTRLGAREIPRDEFLYRLESALEQPTLVGSWTAAP